MRQSPWGRLINSGRLIKRGIQPQWIILPLAGLAEVGWATGLKYAETLAGWCLTVLLATASLALAFRAVRYMPVSTVYTIFVGLGAVGTAMADWVFFGVAFHWPVLAFIGLLLVGVIGLQQVSD